jgi:hypothetical protein
MINETMPVRLKRAALVAEMSDGTRMIYELREPVTLTFEYADDLDMWNADRIRPTATTLTVEGELLRGTVWRGDMPTAPAQEIAEPRKEIAP